jgi:hypothetical protein
MMGAQARAPVMTSVSWPDVLAGCKRDHTTAERIVFAWRVKQIFELCDE